MTAQRSAFDAEHDILQGRSLEAAKDEAARLAAKALELTIYLSRPRAGLTDMVRRNLETERDGYEWSAAGLEARIAEHSGQIQKVREPAAPMSVRARKQRAGR